MIALALLLPACSGKSASNTKSAGDASASAAAAAEGGATAAQEPKEGDLKEPPGLPPPPDVAAPPADAEKTESGLAYKVLEKGKGDTHPRAHDQVTVHYTGWTTDGKMFDSSQVERFPGQPVEPAKFPLNRVIAGWTEGVQLMVPGEKRRFWIPEELAYKGQPGAPEGMLVFDVELLDVKKMPDPPPTPPDVAAPPKDAQKTESGVSSKVLAKSKVKNAKRPKPSDVVKVHYTGWKTDGTMFDSSVSRGEPAVIQLDRVIKGWSEGVPLMTVGEKRRLWIPEELAYKGQEGRPEGMLVFDVELLDILTPETPPDVKEPPKDAQKTESGLASKVLKKGTGKEHPKASDMVKVHYTGWTTDGKMFDSSVVQGQPAEFPLDGVIPGWTEGVQLMTVGERRRFWIPEELAYKGQEGAPKGMLVFDVELLDIQKTDAPEKAEGDAGADAAEDADKAEPAAK